LLLLPVGFIQEELVSPGTKEGIERGKAKPPLPPGGAVAGETKSGLSTQFLRGGC
jgi:hypothetical protein